MWNEHCSYKSSRIHLRGLPTKAPWVIQGPGENAGVVDIGDGLAVVFKMESHNHPSFIEPYQGAATGVGGILRDVFTMGARPIACLNALSLRRAGSSQDAASRRAASSPASAATATRSACRRWAARCTSTRRYDGNILVNAMACGVAEPTRSSTQRPPAWPSDPLSRLQDRPRRHSRRHDGLGRIRRGLAEAKRPTVQVGDPFAEKLLLEACLEIMARRLRGRDPGHGRRRASPARRSRWAPRAISASSSTSTRCLRARPA